MANESDKFNDPFAPPKVPCVVCCIHCGSTYDSWRILWRDMPGEAIDGAWCCPIPGCDGIGFRFDIHPVDPNWEEQNASSMPPGPAFEESAEPEAWEDGFDDDEDEDDEELDLEFDDEDEFALPIDEFEDNAFWIDPGLIAPRRLGASPQPPFNRAPFGHASSSDSFKDDDIPF